MSFAIGIESCVESPPAILESATRFGILSNQASVDRNQRFSHEVLAERFPGRLRALFSPQHGFWGTEQDNMIETPHSSLGGLPVYSLYSEIQSPTESMLEDLELLVVDLQDVGTRVYTFLKTLELCLVACARWDTRVLVLDRPNPLGGELVEGAPVEAGFESLVGIRGFPMRHGLTLAQAALFLRDRIPDLSLEIVSLEGYSRRTTWDDLDRRWIPTSPNLPRPESVAVYPGTVLVEGTNLSEGRGTTTPFEIVGAPFVDESHLAGEMGKRGLDGVVFRPIRFTPTFQKWAGEECGGVFLHVTDLDAFRPYRAAITLLAAIHDAWPDEFRWRDPPYEYEEKLLPIDILSGSSRLREAIDRGLSTRDTEPLANVDPIRWSPLASIDLAY